MRRGPVLPVLRVVHQPRMADHDGCGTVTLRVGNGNDRSRRTIAMRSRLCSSPRKTRDREGSGRRDSALLRVVPHHHSFNLTRSHCLSQSVNRKLISSALTLPPLPISLPFDVASPKRNHHHHRSTRLYPHLCYLHNRPCPYRLGRRPRNDHLPLHAHSRPPSHYPH